MLAKDVDPGLYEEQKGQQEKRAINNTFKTIAMEWLEYRKGRANFS
ncbi:hypothetical protein [Bisgaardia hudsonensis]|nr:hypothetical protein [Bisgaardia hudsonensis]